jgi:hypothetical protein
MDGRFSESIKHFSSDDERISYENELVASGDTVKLTEFLRPLIEDMMDSTGLVDDYDRDAARFAMENEIARATRLYVENGKHINSTYPFSVYYTWFGKEALLGSKRGE